MGKYTLRSIQSSLMTAFVCLVLFTSITLSFVSYQLSANTVKNTAEQYTQELVKQVSANIETYITGMENISQLLIKSNNIRAFLLDGHQMDFNERNEIEQFLHTVLMSRQDIASISIFGYNGQFVSDNKTRRLNPYTQLERQLWYMEAQAAKGDAVLSSSHVQRVFRDEYRWVVSLSRELRLDDDGYGILLVDLNFNIIKDILNSVELGQRGYVFIIDDQGDIVHHPQQQLIYSDLKEERIADVLNRGVGSFTVDEGKDSRIYTIQDSDFGWKIVGVAYSDELITNKQQLQLSFLTLSLFSLVIAILISYLIARKLSMPIRRLQENMKQVERGNFDVQAEVSSSIELSNLSRTFNFMVKQIKELLSQIVQEQETKRKLEINALQSQINPHFLYNTLDSIVWMAEGKKSEEVVLMTSALAKLLRSSISNGQELVPIRTEIEHISNYLTIQRMRYKHKLEFYISAPSDLQHFLTLKLLLQPLVENAIYHGIKNKEGTGIVSISVERKENCILFVVRDNGVGMNRETLQNILQDKGVTRDGRGLGIYNVHKRIQLYFGPEYGLRYESELGEGTTVKVWIPLTVHQHDERIAAKERESQ